MPLKAWYFCKHIEKSLKGKKSGVGGRSNGGVLGIPYGFGSSETWDWQDDFEDGDVDDTWEGWTLTHGDINSCQVNGETHKWITTHVTWKNEDYIKKITLQMDFLFKTGPATVWHGTNSFCEIRFRKTHNKGDAIFLKEKMVWASRKYYLALVSGTSTGYQEVLDYTDEPDEKWLVLGSIKIQADYITKKAKISGLISGEIDINLETQSSYETKIIGGSSIYTYNSGKKFMGIAMDAMRTAAKV